MYRKIPFNGIRWIALLVIVVLFVPFSGTPASAQGASVGLELVAEGLVHPVDLNSPPDGSGRLFVVDQVGVIYIVSADGQLQPFLDIRDRMVVLDPSYDERGLLGLAFHPDFANNGRFFVYYSAPLRAEAPPDWNSTNVLSEFTVSSDNPDLADPATERILLMVDKPQMNHNGGDISFGPDGFLYLPLGDGGGANDVDVGHTEGIGNGQDLSNLLGSLLRIDVNSGDPYGIPADNPFVGNAAVPPETWAYGFRNPWSLHFDVEGGNQLFIADAGQELYEEVSIVTAGGNYGWNVKEGTHCFDPNAPENPPAECGPTGPNGDALIDPVIEFGHDIGIVVVGGAVYRGEAVPELQGQYIFAAWSTSFDAPGGTLLAAMPSGAEGQPWTVQPLTVTNATEPMFILSIEEDANNDLYVLTTLDAGPSGNSGRVWRLVPGGTGGEPTPVVTEVPGEATEEPGDGQASTVDVNLVEFELQMPTSIPGGTVTFNVTNNGTEEHGFEIEGNGVEEELEPRLQPGESGTLTVDLPPGTYEVYCPVDDHRGMGMELELTVTGGTGEEPPPAATEVPVEATEEATPDTTLLPLVVADQAISSDGTVLITSVFSEGPGWMVIHADDSGQPGAVIGYVAVPAGDSLNVAVPIDGSQVTGVLHAMLHVDAGTVGQYEFPGADAPAVDAQGNIIMMPFSVTVTG